MTETRGEYLGGARRWPAGHSAKTYKLGPRLYADLMTAARRLDVSPSDLVCFLLRRGLDAIAGDALEVPRKPAGPLLIDYPASRE